MHNSNVAESWVKRGMMIVCGRNGYLTVDRVLVPIVCLHNLMCVARRHQTSKSLSGRVPLPSTGKFLKPKSRSISAIHKISIAGGNGHYEPSLCSSFSWGAKCYQMKTQNKQKSSGMSDLCLSARTKMHERSMMVKVLYICSRYINVIQIYTHRRTYIYR